MTGYRVVKAPIMDWLWCYWSQVNCLAVVRMIYTACINVPSNTLPCVIKYKKKTCFQIKWEVFIVMLPLGDVVNYQKGCAFFGTLN